MGITAPDWVTLRSEIQNWLLKNIPEDISSKDARFAKLTGMTQKTLEDNWKGGGILTSCNSFAGKVAQGLGVPWSSVLAKGALDISKAESEVPGCWQEANSAEACNDDITPHAGDFYSGWLKVKHKGTEFIQKWGHVGIVYDYEPDTGMWWLVQGGQGGPKMGVDYIKWSHQKFDRTKLNGWVDMARYLMPQGPYAIDQSGEPDRRAAIYTY